VTHLAACIWWYLGVVDLDDHDFENYAELEAFYEQEKQNAALGIVPTPSHPEHRRLLGISSADPNKTTSIGNSDVEVYQPSGRAALNLWSLYYHGLGEEDLWLDRYATCNHINRCVSEGATLIATAACCSHVLSLVNDALHCGRRIVFSRTLHAG
jgi:hypothetical protein